MLRCRSRICPRITRKAVKELAMSSSSLTGTRPGSERKCVVHMAGVCLAIWEACGLACARAVLLGDCAKKGIYEGA